MTTSSPTELRWTSSRNLHVCIRPTLASSHSNAWQTEQSRVRLKHQRNIYNHESISKNWLLNEKQDQYSRWFRSDIGRRCQNTNRSGYIFPEFSVERISRPEIQSQQKGAKKTKTHPPHQGVFHTKEIHAVKERTCHEKQKAVGSKMLRQFKWRLLCFLHFSLEPLFKKANHAPATRSIAGTPAK